MYAAHLLIPSVHSIQSSSVRDGTRTYVELELKPAGRNEYLGTKKKTRRFISSIPIPFPRLKIRSAENAAYTFPYSRSRKTAGEKLKKGKFDIRSTRNHCSLSFANA